MHGALVASGVPEKDRVHGVLELGPEDFRFDAAYLGVTTPRTDEFVLIEVLLSAGRSVTVKKIHRGDAGRGLSFRYRASSSASR